MVLNRLEKGVARVATLLNEKFPVSVVYSNGTHSATIVMTKAGVRLANKEAAQNVDQDFLLSPSLLVLNGSQILPAPGHTITINTSVFEVRRESEFEDCYRVDQTGQLLRIHTKAR